MGCNARRKAMRELTVRRFLERCKSRNEMPSIHYWKRVVREVKRKNNKKLKEQSWFCFVDIDSTPHNENTKAVRQSDEQQYKVDNESEVYLTRREMQCVACVLRGKPYKKIATLLGISPRTIQSYIDAARHKLDCANVKQLISVIKKSDLMKKIPYSIEDIVQL